MWSFPATAFGAALLHWYVTSPFAQEIEYKLLSLKRDFATTHI
jgi:hypothetical protein